MRISIQDAGTCDGLGIERGYAAIRQAGFDAIDWNIDHALSGPVIRNGNYRGKCIFEKPLEDVIAYYAEELAIIRKNGLAITLSAGRASAAGLHDRHLLPCHRIL